MYRYFRSPDQEYISVKQNIEYGVHQMPRFRYIVFGVQANMHAYYNPDYWLRDEEAQWCDENLHGEYQVEGGSATIQGVYRSGNIASFEHETDAHAFMVKWYPEAELIIMTEADWPEPASNVEKDVADQNPIGL